MTMAALFLCLAVLIQTSLQTSLPQSCRQGVNCHLPSCFCSTINHHLDVKDIPQIIYFGFDDALTNLVGEHYRDLFSGEQRNPNGCPISMSLYVQHEYTNYSLVHEFYERGMEIGVHGLSHTNVETRKSLKREAEAQKVNLSHLGKVPLRDIVGWRSPFLRTAGDDQADVLRNLGYTYDISLTINMRGLGGNRPWPYTLDYGYPYECMIPPCPEVNVSHPGFWEVPVNYLMDRNNVHPCVFVDGCISRPRSTQEAFDYLWTNFQSYYRTNKAPFGLNMHAAWFWTPHNKKAMRRFIKEVLSLPGQDVYIVTVKQMLDWMRQPTSVKKLHTLASWNTCRNQAPKYKNNKLSKNHGFLKSADKGYYSLEKALPRYAPRSVPEGPIRSQSGRKGEYVDNWLKPINSVAASGPPRDRARYQTSRTNHVARSSNNPSMRDHIRQESSRRETRGKTVNERPVTKPNEDRHRIPSVIGKSRGTVVMSEQKRRHSGRYNIRERSKDLMSTKTDPRTVSISNKRRYRTQTRRIKGPSGESRASGRYQNWFFHDQGGEKHSNDRSPFGDAGHFKSPTGSTKRNSPIQNEHIQPNPQDADNIFSSSEDHAIANVAGSRRPHSPRLRNKVGRGPRVRPREHRKNRVQIVYERGQYHQAASHHTSAPDYPTAPHYTSVPEDTWIFGPRQTRDVVERIDDGFTLAPVSSAVPRSDTNRRQWHRKLQFSESVSKPNYDHAHTNTRTESNGGGRRSNPNDYRISHVTVKETLPSPDQGYEYPSSVHGRNPFGHLKKSYPSKQTKPRRSQPRNTGWTSRKKLQIIRVRPSVRPTERTRRGGYDNVNLSKRQRPRLIGGRYPNDDDSNNSNQYQTKNRDRSFHNSLRHTGTIHEVVQKSFETGNKDSQNENRDSSNSRMMGTYPPKLRKSSRSVRPHQRQDGTSHTRVRVGVDRHRGYSEVRNPFKHIRSQRNKKQYGVEPIERQHQRHVNTQRSRDTAGIRERTTRVEHHRMTDHQDVVQNDGQQSSPEVANDYSDQNTYHKYTTVQNPNNRHGPRIENTRNNGRAGVNIARGRRLIPLPIERVNNGRTRKSTSEKSTYDELEPDIPRSALPNQKRRSEFGFSFDRRRAYIIRRLNGKWNGQMIQYNRRTRRDTGASGASRRIHKRDVPHSMEMSVLPMSDPYNARCPQDSCHLPSCFCRTTSPPGGLPVTEIPQIVLLTFDGSVSWSTFPMYNELFQPSRKNPNGCPISGTFFVPSQGNSQDQLTQLTHMGMEIAVKGLSRNISEDMDYLQDVLPLTSIWGWKSDQKPLSGKEFDSIDGSQMVYDSSLHLPLTGSFTNRPWPYTLDHGWQDCDGPACPTTIQHGLWEVPVTPVLDHKGSYKCVYADGCYWNPPTAEDTYNFFWNNFQKHYSNNRAPISFAFRQAWFHTAFKYNRIGLERFVDKLTTLGDTYIISIGRLLEWVKQPTRLSQVANFQPWQC